jgi:uncharacterized membrane protein
MNTKRGVLALLIGIVTLIVSFVLTNVAYIKWAVWRYPQHNSMAGLSAFMLGLVVAPACALLSVGLFLFMSKRRVSN